MGEELRLGLIGDNIAASQAPRLHRLAGRQAGMAVRYDRLVPPDMGATFEEVFEQARSGYRGVNVTYPYKERAVASVEIDAPLVLAMGAINTVIFADGKATGHNTDHTGFVSAYRAVLGDAAPGTVLMIGAGGVGRAVAFGLAALGARKLRIADRDAARARALAQALNAGAPEMAVSVHEDGEAAASGADGLVNCTPLGMVGYGGTPLPAGAMRGASWAFDAVYTPADTTFLGDAAAAGLALIPGWELFFFQGVHAWDLFAGAPLDRAALRAALLAGEDA